MAQAHDHAGHDHGGHSHAGGAHSGHAHGGRGASRKRLAITLGLVSLYLVAEVVGGLLTNSLALLADAGHMLSDAAALALSLFAMWIAERPPTPRRSYGYYRTASVSVSIGVKLLILAKKASPKRRSKSRTKLKPLFIARGASASCVKT